MKKLLLMVFAGILLTPMTVPARDWGYPRLQGQQQQGKRGPGEYPRGGQDFRRDRDARPPRDERQPGRMTEQERRELHRDLDRANREIYRRNPPRPDR
jgi:hypothetical protein